MDLFVQILTFRDVDRVRTFYEIAKRTNRKLVINLKNAPLFEIF